MFPILVVDDDPEILQLLKMTLEQAGHEVITAQTGAEFLAQAMVQQPELIVLDIMLGEDFGPDLYDKLLAQGFDKRIPVIFLSALAEDRPMEEPRPGHRYALLGKPFDTAQLLREIETLTR